MARGSVATCPPGAAACRFLGNLKLCQGNKKKTKNGSLAPCPSSLVRMGHQQMLPHPTTVWTEAQPDGPPCVPYLPMELWPRSAFFFLFLLFLARGCGPSASASLPLCGCAPGEAGSAGPGAGFSSLM